RPPPPPPETPMPTVMVRCPNQRCAKALRITVNDGAAQLKCRCPGCRAPLSVALKKASPPAPPKPAEEDEGGTYGFAQETSLTYLLGREADGHRLSDGERADKRRLIAERLAASPRRCPACEGKLGRDALVCVACGLNMKTGKRPVARAERAAEGGGE